jgi:hypothetical protein
MGANRVWAAGGAGGSNGIENTWKVGNVPMMNSVALYSTPIAKIT